MKCYIIFTLKHDAVRDISIYVLIFVQQIMFPIFLLECYKNDAEVAKENCSTSHDMDAT